MTDTTHLHKTETPGSFFFCSNYVFSNFVNMMKEPFCVIQCKNAISYGGSAVLYTAFTVSTVYTVHTVQTVLDCYVMTTRAPRAHIQIVDLIRCSTSQDKEMSRNTKPSKHPVRSRFRFEKK